MLQTMTFQAGDASQRLHTGQNHHDQIHVWTCCPSSRQLAGGARNARLWLDRRPCSPYWLPERRNAGDNVLDEFSHNRNKTFMTLRAMQEEEEGGRGSDSGQCPVPPPVTPRESLVLE